MSYAAAIEQLSSLAPELYLRQGQPRRRFSLDEVRTLLHRLGDPHRQFQSVLIGGTNGKGSTASTLASILTEAGLRTGLYTSPHLEKPNERVRVNGADMSDADFARLYFKVDDAAREAVSTGELQQPPSFFETLTALAFLNFAEKHIDIATLEVGMGGRLDATNVVAPLLSIITDISLDHMEWLGPTIGAIAKEKAGILRHGGTLITLPQHPEANQALGDAAKELDVRTISAVPFVPAAGTEGAYPLEVLGATIHVNSPLAGAHQQRNVALAIAAAVELAEKHGLPITPAAVEAGIRRTRWPGRLERVTANGVEWVLDVAHNPAGAWALRAGLRDLLESSQPRTLIFSCLRDKPVAEMARILFPLFDQVIVTPIQSPRATAPEDLLAAARAVGVEAIAAESVRRAMTIAVERSIEGVVVVSGSVYLVGEMRGLLLAKGNHAQ